MWFLVTGETERGRKVGQRRNLRARLLYTRGSEVNKPQLLASEKRTESWREKERATGEAGLKRDSVEQDRKKKKREGERERERDKAGWNKRQTWLLPATTQAQAYFDSRNDISGSAGSGFAMQQSPWPSFMPVSSRQTTTFQVLLLGFFCCRG